MFRVMGGWSATRRYDVCPPLVAMEALTEILQNEQHFSANGELSNYKLSHWEGAPQFLSSAQTRRVSVNN